MHTEWTMQGLTLEAPADAVNRTHLQVDIHPSSGQVVCNGYPGHLQFYDLVNDSFSSSQEVHLGFVACVFVLAAVASPLCATQLFQIVSYTRVSRTHDKKTVPPVVDHFAFSERPIDVIGHVRANVTRAGRYLATVDSRFGEKTTTETSLKFWELTRGMQEYAINTQIDNPHGAARVTCLKFHPSEESVLTAASDGSVKIWHRVVQPKAARYICAHNERVCGPFSQMIHMPVSGWQTAEPTSAIAATATAAGVGRHDFALGLQLLDAVQDHHRSLGGVFQRRLHSGDCAGQRDHAVGPDLDHTFAYLRSSIERRC